MKKRDKKERKEKREKRDKKKRRREGSSKPKRDLARGKITVDDQSQPGEDDYVHEVQCPAEHSAQGMEDHHGEASQLK